MNNDNDELLFQRADGIESPTEFFFEHIHTVTDGFWGPAISLMVFSIVFLSLDSDARSNFAAASFATMVVTVMLIPFGLMGSSALLLVSLLIVIAIAINRGQQGGGI